MTRHTTSTITQDTDGPRPRWLGVACATLLTAAVVGSLAGWRLHEQGRVRPLEPRGAAAATTVPVEQSLLREVSAAHYLYLVSSEAAAAQLWYLLSEGEPHRYQTGERSLRVSVLVTAGLDDDVVGVLTGLHPDQQVVDLRRW